MPVYDVTIEATITVRVVAADTAEDLEHDAEEQAMDILDALETDTILVGELTCVETAWVPPDRWPTMLPTKVANDA